MPAIAPSRPMASRTSSSRPIATCVPRRPMPQTLFIAAVVGPPGREVVKRLLPALRRRHDVSLVICNAENSAAGFGCTRDSAADLFKAGVDVITGGNHIWDRRESLPYL